MLANREEMPLDKSLMFSIIGKIELLFIENDIYFIIRASFEIRNNVL